MKKNILVILLAAGLLVGCDFDINSLINKKSSTSDQETQEKDQNSSENTGEIQNSSGENQTSTSQTQTDQNQQNQQSQTQGETEYTATINLSGNAFSGVATSAGVNIDSTLLSGNSNAKKLEDACKAQLSDSSLLYSLECKKLNSAVWNDVCMLQIGTGNYAKNDFNPGTFTWNSTKNIYKVEISVQCYAKAGYSLDSSAHLMFDLDDLSLEAGSEEELEFKTFTKEYEHGARSFSLVSKNGRVFINSMKITWRY